MTDSGGLHRRRSSVGPGKGIRGRQLAGDSQRFSPASRRRQVQPLRRVAAPRSSDPAAAGGATNHDARKAGSVRDPGHPAVGTPAGFSRTPRARLAGDCRARPVPGAGGRTRTDTLLPEPDFESGASTNSATPARSACRDSTPLAPTSQVRTAPDRLHWVAGATILPNYGRAGPNDAQCIGGPGRFTTGPAGIKPEKRLPGR